MRPDDELLSDELLRSLREELEGRTDAVVSVMNSDMTVVWASEAGSAGLFGRELDDFVGVGARYFVHPNDFPGYEEAVTRALQGREGSWEGRVSAADGSWVWARCSLRPTRSRDGVVVVTLRGGF